MVFLIRKNSQFFNKTHIPIVKHIFDQNVARCRSWTHQTICPILNDFSMIKLVLETISLRNLTLKKLASLAYDVFSRYVSMFNAVWVHSSRSKIDLWPSRATRKNRGRKDNKESWAGRLRKIRVPKINAIQKMVWIFLTHNKCRKMMDHLKFIALSHFFAEFWHKFIFLQW